MINLNRLKLFIKTKYWRWIMLPVLMALIIGWSQNTATQDKNDHKAHKQSAVSKNYLNANSETRLGPQFNQRAAVKTPNPISQQIHDARQRGDTEALQRLEAQINRPAQNIGESQYPVIHIKSKSRGLPGTPVGDAQSFDPALDWGNDIHVRGVNTTFRESYPAMATASDGTIYCVWENFGQSGENGYLQFYYSTDGGDSWSAYGFITNATFDLMQPSLAIGEGSEDWLVCAYAVDSTVSYIEVATIPLIGGGGFSTNIVVPDFFSFWENYEKPNVWTDSYDWNGWYIYLTAEAVFNSGANNYNLIFWHSTDFGGTYDSPPQVPLGNSDPDEWRDPDGTYGTTGNDVFIATFNASDNNLYMIKSTDFGGSWSDTVQVNLVDPLPTHAVDPDIEAATDFDNIMLCCVKSFNSADNIAQTYSTDAGATWSSLFSLEGYTSTNEFAPELTANEGGSSWHVAYTSADWWVYYSRRPQDLSGFWQATPDVVNDVDFASASYTKKAITSNWTTDEAGIAWADYREGTPDYDIYFDHQFAASPLYQGPASGSISGGAMQNTGNFPMPAHSNISPSQIKGKFIRNYETPLQPNPPNMTPPLAPEGSNEVDDENATLDAPNLVTDFAGIPDDANSAGFSFIPPDPICAAGPDYIMACVNTDFGIFDKVGNELVEIDATEWFENVLSGLDPGFAEPFGAAFDPQVAYDHFAGRWVMLYIATDNSSESYLLLSVSDDDNPIGMWYNYAIPGHQNGSTVNTNLNDYPKLGLDNYNFYVTANMFDLTTDLFQYVQLRVLEKSQFYNNPSGPISWVDFWDMRDPDNLNQALITIVPAMTYGFPASEYLINDSPYMTSTFMTLWRLVDPTTVDSLAAENVPVTAQDSPPNAQQLGGGTPLIDVGGRRVRNAVYRDGMLVTSHSVADGTGSYARARFLEIDVAGPSVSYDISFGATDSWYYYPAVTLDDAGNTVAVFSRSGSTEYAGVRYTGITGGSIQSSALLKAGESNYIKTFSGSRNRWGDYSGIAVDPTNENYVWMFGEYAASPANTWGTWWGEVTFGPTHPSPENLEANSGYDHAVPMYWDPPVGFAPLNVTSLGSSANLSGVVKTNQVKQDQGGKSTANANSLIVLESYNVYRSTSSGGPYNLLANVDRQYFRDFSANNGTPYYYVIEAVYATGVSGYSNEMSATATANGFVINSSFTNTPPTIDGNISSGEWSSATMTDITATGVINPVTLYTYNDGSYLYLAVDDPNNTTLEDFDQLGIYFDENIDYEWPPTLPSEEGNFWAQYISGAPQTDFRGIAGWWPNNLNFDTPSTANGISDGISTSAGHVQYEVRIDLSNSELNASPGDDIGFFIFSYEAASGLFQGDWPQPVDASGLSNTTWAAPFAYGTLSLSSMATTNSISGNVDYAITAAALANVTLDISGGTSGNTMSNSSGSYSFSGLTSGLNYTVTPSKSGGFGSFTIAFFDASLIARHAVGLITLDANQQRAADVDRNSSIQFFDAANVARFAVGLPALPGTFAGEWDFDPANRTYTPLSSDMTNEDYSAFLLGDVDGNYPSRANGLAKSNGESAVYPYLSELKPVSGEELTLPVLIGKNADMYSGYIELEYPDEILALNEISLTEASQDFQLVANTAQPGLLRAGWYGTKAIEEPGEIAEIRFTVKGSPGSAGEISLSNFQINDEPSQKGRVNFRVYSLDELLITSYDLQQNYPNPFNPSTTIKYQLANKQAQHTTLRIYNSAGQLVRTLVNRDQENGKYSVVWNGLDNRGHETASGIYFYRLNSGSFVQTRKLLKMK